MKTPILKLLGIVDGEVRVMYEGKPTSAAWGNAMDALGGRREGLWRVVCGQEYPFGGYMVRITDRAVIRALEGGAP